MFLFLIVRIMSKDKIIRMEHGAGGEAMQTLIRDVILNNITNRSAGIVAHLL